MSARPTPLGRRGFALVAVLWLLAALAVLSAGALAVARTEAGLSRNRLTLARAEWAREACGEILLARYAQDSATRRVDSIGLGRTVWCRARLEDPGARLNVNTAEADVLRRAFGSDSLVDALLDWRDPDDTPRRFGAERDWYRMARRRAPRNGALADVAELALVRGFDTAMVRRVAPLLTTRGDGTVDVNLAPAGVLAALPGLTPSAVDLITMRRSARPFTGAAEIAALLAPPDRDALLGAYDDLLRTTRYTSTQLVAIVEGAVGDEPARSRALLTVVPAAGRLAVVRRETE